MNKEIIRDTEFGGERPLFGRRHLFLDHVTFLPGESALKRCVDVEARNCEFLGKYPFWHVNGFRIDRCTFRPGARAALWYSQGLEMTDTLVEAPKMFREMRGLKLHGVRITDAQETLWHCTGVEIEDCSVSNADYLFMHSSNIAIDRWTQQGNYSFQYCSNVRITNAHIDSKDAFWGTENVTVEDSELNGEYLGWHSRNLTLVRCRISGTQPLCYCRELTLIDCVFAPDCDLAFEESEVNARILSPVTSIKNPIAGSITAPSIGEVIIDEHSMAVTPVEINTDR